MSFDVTRRIRFADVDPAGIVFYPRYFEMINATIEDWFEQGVGYGFDAMIVNGPHGVPLARMEAEFKAPSRLDDTLVFSLVVREKSRRNLPRWEEDECEEDEYDQYFDDDGNSDFYSKERRLW